MNLALWMIGAALLGGVVGLIAWFAVSAARGNNG